MLAFLLDTLEQGVSGFEFVRVVGAPLGGELALEGMFEQCLAIDLELGLGAFQAFDALVQYGEQFFDLGDDSALLICWRHRKFAANEIGCSNASLTNCAGHVGFSLVSKGTRRYKIVDVLWNQADVGSQHMKFRRPEPQPILYGWDNSHLPVFHTRRNLRKENVSCLEWGVALLNRRKFPSL